MEIYLGSDHGGYELKQKIQDYLQKKEGWRVIDLGVFSVEPPSDYPDIAQEVAEKVLENPGSFGILVCGTGVGMCMAANRIKGIRAANCDVEECAKMSRIHNNANILCVGGRILDFKKAQKIIDIFLATDFEGAERHVRRVEKMDKINP